MIFSEAIQQADFALIDTSWSDSLIQELYHHSSELTISPLYLGTELEPLALSGPILINLEQSVLDLTWLEQALIKSHGYLLLATDKQNLEFHLKRLVYVLHPVSGKVLFRFFDARHVMALNRVEVDHFLWPGISNIFTYSGYTLGWQMTNCPTHIKADIEQEHLIKLSDYQCEILTSVAREKAISDLTEHINTFFPAFTDNDAPVIAVRCIDEATALGFNSAKDVYYFTNIVCSLGFECYQTDIYPEIKSLIITPSLLTPSQRIEQAALLVDKYKRHQEKTS